MNIKGMYIVNHLEKCLHTAIEIHTATEMLLK